MRVVRTGWFCGRQGLPVLAAALQNESRRSSPSLPCAALRVRCVSCALPFLTGQRQSARASGKPELFALFLQLSGATARVFNSEGPRWLSGSDPRCSRLARREATPTVAHACGYISPVRAHLPSEPLLLPQWIPDCSGPG